MTLRSAPLIIGRFGRAFGVSGWIKIISFTDPKENILDFKQWLIKKKNSLQRLEATAINPRLQPPAANNARPAITTRAVINQDVWEEFNYSESKIHAGSVVIKLPNCNSPEAASLFTNAEIAIWHSQLPQLKNDEYYCVDLIGLEVINKDNIKLGIVQDIMPTGSNDVLIVGGERRRLIPYLSHVILKVDLAEKSIRVDWEEDF